MKKHLLLLFAALLPFVASAHDFEVGGIYYNISSETDKTAAVTFKGDRYNSYDEYSGAITIPAVVTNNGEAYSVTSIGDDAFYDCFSLTSITIPESVTRIGGEAFCECLNLSSITIPEDSELTSIEDFAFEGCKNITAITIPSKVESIKRWAFRYCNFSSIFIPENVSFIGEGAFSSFSLTSIIVDPNNKVYDSRNNCNAIVKSDDNILITGCPTTVIPTDVVSIDNAAFYERRNLTSITIPESVSSIGSYAFEGCSSLTSITIPESVTSFGQSTFSNCSSLTSLTISENVTSIGNHAFLRCSSLTSINIPENSQLTSIGDYAFYECSNLNSITLPANMTRIGESAFANCRKLRDVYSKAESVPNAATSAFDGFNSEYATLHVPASALNSYKTTSPWSSFGKFETMSIAVSSITLSQSSATLTEGGTLTLIATVTPDDATDKSISWSSSNTTVVSVDANGQVTAIAPGTATITATANDGSGMKAPCKVTVLSDLSLSTQQLKTGDTFEYTNTNGVLKTYTVVGENLIENPSFDNNTTGWVGGGGGSLTGVDWHSNGGVDDGAYLRLTENAGKGGNGSIGTAWPLEKGKTYVFSYFIRQNTSTDAVAKEGYIVTSQTNTPRGDETKTIMYGYEDANCAWTQNIVVTTAEFDYLQFCARWLSGRVCFDAFILAEVSEAADPAELEALLANCQEWLDTFADEAKGLDAFEPVVKEAQDLVDSDEYTADDLNAMVHKLSEALLDFRMANASEDYTVDVTNRYLKNPNFENGLSDWTRNNDAVNNGSNIRFHQYFGEDSRVLEINGQPSVDTYVKQTVYDLPLGYYRFTVQCVMNHSVDMTDPEAKSGAAIYCNIWEKDMVTQQITTDGATKENSYPETFSVVGYVTDNKIEVGLKGIPNSNFSYVAIDNIRLEYLGARVISFSDCGPNLKWSLEKGKLLIEGEGAMYDFSSESEVPWIESQKEITDVVLNHGVSSIGEFAFSGCTNLSSITIPASVNKIGKHAFSSCSSLTSVTIPEGVTSIEDGTFSNCSKLTSIVIPSSITCIEQNAFRACLRLESIAIPNSVTYIGNSAFAFCNNLTDLTIGNSVTNIEECAFQACGLKSLEIPNSVITLGRAAFADCSKLTSIIIPKSITNMGDNPFSDCPGLESIIVEEANSVYDSRNNCNAIIHKETNVLISGCKNTIIPNGVTRIGNSAFHNCDGLTSIVIPNSVTTIGNMAFCACDGLTSIVIPNSVTTIGDIAFENSSRDKGLNHVTIGSNVTSIGVRAFDCYSITSIKSLIPSERLFGLYNNVFDTRVNKNKCTLFVPQDAISKYKATDGWKDFTNIQEIKNKVTYVINGEIFVAYDVAYGTNIPIPSKTGYTLICDEIPETMPAEDIIITGTFIANRYLVTFKIGDEVIAADSIEYGTVIVAPEAPEKEGYTFNGWGEIAETVPAHDLTYEGSYSINFYNLTYMVDGKKYHQENVKYGTEIEAMKEPTKEGYTFSGWSEIPETMPAKDITITGTFIANKYLITFMIDGVVISSESLGYGSKITPPNVPNLEGYTFSGWGEVAETVPAHNVTYEGSYSVNSYNIIYMVDGNKYYQESVKYGTAIELITEPTKEGHTFSGWSEIPETMPAEDITINGTFIINKYLVTFMIDDIVLASDSLEYGSTITLPSTPPYREGYTFSGWGEVAETVPANDVTYSAYYIANVYKVYYFVGSKLVNMVEVTYGEPIPEYIYEPEEGYTFLGWVGDTYETMPAHDVTYTANIESGINQITIDNGQLNIYDLMGRKVTDTENLTGGIYIIGGKKVIIK